MAATIQTSQGSATTTASTSHTITLPSGVVSGDLILIIFSIPGNNPSSAPSGFSELFNSYDSDSNIKTAVWYKIATGSEGSTVTATTTFSLRSVTMTLRIDSENTTTPLSTSTLNGVISSTPNPTAVTPSWGSAENLYIVAAIYGSFGGSISSYPSGYTSVNTSHNEGGASTDYDIGVAQKTATSSSEDPGAFTLSSGYEVNVFTLAVQGAASGPANVKSVAGVAKASIKTVAGVAIASIKKVAGVA